jgi:signal peptidase I
MFLKRLGAFFLDILEVVALAIAIFLFIYLLILQPHKIKGASMEPNYHDREYLLTDKVTYRFNEPERGDVIVFEPPLPNIQENGEYIKRIIGLPGESVMIKDGSVYINGKLLEENYLRANGYTENKHFAKEGETIVIPKDNYFVLGDNREYSSDSREWGFVPKENITGRAWVIYWPPQRVGLLEKVNYGAISP